MTRKKQGMQWLASIIILVVVSFSVHALTAYTYNPRDNTSRSVCASNLKQHLLSAVLYANDHDDTMPLAHNWYTALRPFRKSEELRCPTVAEAHENALGYAYDSRMHGVSIYDVPTPATQTLIFESTSVALNTSDPFTSIPIPGRHNGRNSIGYADGHLGFHVLPVVAPKKTTALR